MESQIGAKFKEDDEGGRCVLQVAPSSAPLIYLPINDEVVVGFRYFTPAKSPSLRSPVVPYVK